MGARSFAFHDAIGLGAEARAVADLEDNVLSAFMSNHMYPDPSTNPPQRSSMLSIEQAQAILEVSEAYGLAQDNFVTLIDERSEGRSPEDAEVIEVVEKFIDTRAAFERALQTHGVV